VAETFTHVTLALFLFFLLVSFFYYLWFYSRLAFYAAPVYTPGVGNSKNEVLAGPAGYPVLENASPDVGRDLGASLSSINFESRQQISSGMAIPVSVIICAQNENSNLQRLLPKILDQSYPEYEVIVVDDGSTDDTRYTLQDFQQRFPRLRSIELSEQVKNKQGKKFALMMGIKGAKYDRLLLTDADCEPSSNRWIELMQDRFSEKKTIVLGYSPYRRRLSFLNSLIRYETLITATNYLSFALANIPYMGVGRNLAYDKKLFFESKGFSSHIHIMSGDDDLFINKVANAVNTAIEIHPDSFIWSEPKKTPGEFFRQKMRHMSVGRYYKPLHKNLLAFHAVSTLLFYGCFVVLLVLRYKTEYVLGFFGFRLILQLVILGRISHKLASPELGVLSPFYDVIYHLYLMIFSVTGLVYKQKSWK